MGKKNNKSGAQPMSPEKYIKEKARMLPGKMPMKLWSS